MSIDKETLSNLRFVDGVLKQVFRDSKGNEIIRDIEGAKPPVEATPFSERFNSTDTVPHNDAQVKTSVLVKKDIAKTYTTAVHDSDAMMVFIQKHLDTVLEHHAMLIEVFGAPENFDDERAAKAREFFSKNPAFKAYLMKHLALMGEVWAKVLEKLK